MSWVLIVVVVWVAVALLTAVLIGRVIREAERRERREPTGVPDSDDDAGTPAVLPRPRPAGSERKHRRARPPTRHSLHPDSAAGLPTARDHGPS